VKGLIAGAAGAALLLAGGTWALWYDSDEVIGQQLLAGNLDLKPKGAPVLWDISTITGVNSADRTTFVPGATRARADWDTEISGLYSGEWTTEFAGVRGHEAVGANAGHWTAVPGDTVLLELPYEVALQGDNLVAQLKLTPKGTLVLNQQIIDLRVRVFLNTGTVGSPSWKKVSDLAIANTLGLTLTAGTPLLTQLLQAANEDDGTDDEYNSQVIPVVNKTTTGADANLVIALEVTFDPKTFGQNEAKQTLVDFGTNGLSVELEQTRDSNIGWF
jgi:predicted ribosomally synthesized peptide with SipW-like signal peptide